MFVDYSVALCRTERNRIPLWVCSLQFNFGLHLAALFCSIELRVIKGFTAGSMLDSYFHPYSHSLITAVTVSSGGIYKTVCGRPIRLAQAGLATTVSLRL
jgi:hypothetical protein